MANPVATDTQGSHVVNVLMLADRVEVALPAARALARLGYGVGAAASRADAPALASSAVAHRHIFPDRFGDQEAWTSALHAAVSRCGYNVVLACNDIDVVRLRAASTTIATSPSISAGQHILLDKGELAKVCADVGVRYPRTFVPAAMADDASVAAAVDGRAVVKAATPAEATNRGIVHVPGMTAVANAGEAIQAMARYRVAGVRPIVQEHVDGRKIQAIIVRRNGVTSCRLAALVELGTPAEATLRRLDAGSGVGGDCVAALERVADRVGYGGILQAEFVTLADREVCLIDVNPRLWGGVSFAELIGLRITERVVLDALGLAAPAQPVEAAGRRYHHVARELTYLVRSPGKTQSVVARWSRGDVWDAPDPRDPRPLLAHSWQRLRALSKRSPRDARPSLRVGPG